ncbi:hypothetical protein BKA61DRAFT_733873 [Leptodontidium sp. MPI-SDFR-AT-0119]|nr:hypothetical protein BKA61DRAFT_733873 [Leptodontidium sp. MPI-SDFR-AT-0119]
MDYSASASARPASTGSYGQSQEWPAQAQAQTQAQPQPQPQNAKRRRFHDASNLSSRVPIACAACRDRKTRCSGEQPSCSFCRKAGIDCFYSHSATIVPMVPQNTTPVGLDAWGSRILGAIDKLASSLTNAAPLQSKDQGVLTSDMASRRSILSVPMQASSERGCTIQTTSPQNSMTSIYGDEDTQGSGHVLEVLSLRRSMAQPENAPFGLWWSYTIEETLSWPILDFKGNISVGLDALMDSTDEEGDDEEQSPNSTRKGKGRRRLKRVKRSLDDEIMVPDLIESFLKHAHTMNPILEPSVLRKNAASMIEDGLGWDGETCQVLLACAIGAILDPWDISNLTNFSHPKTSVERHAIGQDYFNAAQKRIGNLWSHCSLISAQCLFLTGVFLVYTHEPVAAWRAFNSASVTCRAYISKMIARRNKGLPLPASYSMEQRLCWSSIKSEREIAAEFGMETSGLNLIAYSSQLPTPPNGYAVDINQEDNTPAAEPVSDSPASTNSSIHYEERSWYYYLTEIMLQKVEMRIDIYTHEKRREAYNRANDSPESFFTSMVHALKEFDYQLAQYFDSLPPIMKFPLDDPLPCADELRQYLRWRVYCVRHDITIPALYILIHNDTTHWDRSLVADLISLANTCLALDEKFLSMAISTHRHQATWLGPRRGVRSALIIIAAARLAAKNMPVLEKLCVPEGALWGKGGETLMKGLDYWSSESRDCEAYVNLLQRMHPAFRVEAQGTADS